MSSNVGFGKSEGGRLLRDIEEISKALYVHKTPSKALLCPLKPSFLTDLLRNKEKKKSSLWNWNPLKTLAHKRNQRFSCCFFVHVHAIEGLPFNFNDLSLCVSWKQKDAVLTTRPAEVSCGTAEFCGETLMHQCLVYGSRSGPQRSAKYEPKLFLLKASVVGAPALDIGEHWIDLTRLLPLTLEELEEGKRNSGKWTTSFKLSGKAKGAALNVSFSFSVFDSNSTDAWSLQKQERVENVEDFGFFLECLESTEAKFGSSHGYNSKYTAKECEESDFTLQELGIELCSQNQLKPEQASVISDNSLVETIDVAEVFQDYETDEHDKDSMVEELESIFSDQGDYFLTKSSYRASERAKSLSLDDVTEAVANDFLDMLGIKDSPDSPRERIREQFEREILCSTNTIHLDRVASTGCGRVACSDDFDLSVFSQEAKKEQKRPTLSIINKRNLKTLENLETEALMSKWKLNEKSFQLSPRSSSGGFGSPIYLPRDEEPLELPPLGEGLGPVIQTESGGFLRSMNPLLFRSAKNASRLIMQVSRSVVLPAVMGSSTMEILERWASKGIEKFSLQANMLMPLDDITGKTIEQIAGETESKAKVDMRFCMPTKLKNQCEVEDVDYVSPEDLVPLALTKVEALTIEGLRIQSNLSDTEAPSSIRGAFGLQHENAEENDELVKLCFSLDEQNYGLLDRNFTLALRVQLRDPSRNAETVGAPMVVLIHVEQNVEEHERSSPRFRMSEIQVAGLNAENGDGQICSTRRQKQSGSRWLLSSGIGRAKRRPFSTSNALVKSSLPMKGQNCHWDILWSISSIHARNPDIVLPIVSCPNTTL